MKNICEEISFLANNYLGLTQWGFKESMQTHDTSDSKKPAVIYDSEWCKIRIAFKEWHPPHQSKEYSIDIFYGRLNVPNDKNTIIWNNDECYCWHGVVKVLHFIDGIAPENAASKILSHELINQFRSDVSHKDLAHKLPEWEIRKHAYIWKQYAPRLFEVFDLRHPELWDQYRGFLKNVYDIKGRSPAINPPLDKVC